MIRLSDLQFNRTQGGPQQRQLRTTAIGPAAAVRKEGVGGLSFLSEDMHNYLLATCEALDEEHNAQCPRDEYNENGELLNPAPGIEYEEEETYKANMCLHWGPLPGRDSRHPGEGC